MTLPATREKYEALINTNDWLIDRSIFSDPDVYRDELRQIFARTWNFVAHEVQLPDPGSYFQTWIGGDPVIVTKDKQGEYNVFINSCRHRGNAVCKADEGHANSFMCQYHGWTYDLKGRLVGVPGYKEIYYEELNRAEWGLVTAAKVESYGGLIFATMDPNTPPLMEYLGEIGKLTIDYFNMKQPKRYVGMFKWSIDCNWKFAVDNVWDWYHVHITHQSAGMAQVGKFGGVNYVLDRSPSKPQREVVALGEYGHAIGGMGFTGDRPGRPSAITPEQRQALGPLGAKMAGFGGIFPNLWLSADSIEWRVPFGPNRTEMWHLNFAERTGGGGVGPTSMFDQDDAENWILSTRGANGVVINRHPLHYAAALGHGEVLDIEGVPLHMDNKNWTEQGQRWHYQNWANWMMAEDWTELKATRPKVPEGIV